MGSSFLLGSLVKVRMVCFIDRLAARSVAFVAFKTEGRLRPGSWLGSLHGGHGLERNLLMGDVFQGKVDAETRRVDARASAVCCGVLAGSDFGGDVECSAAVRGSRFAVRTGAVKIGVVG